MLVSGNGRPAEIAAATHGAPSGSTPMIRTCGWWVRNQAAAPDIKPPPPTGRITTSGTNPSCSTASAMAVPCPAAVRGSLKAGTRMRSLVSANRAAAREAWS